MLVVMGNLGATGKVVVMWLVSNPRNSLLCKNREMVGPFPGPCLCGSFKCTGLPF